jgi:hypothetical protein
LYVTLVDEEAEIAPRVEDNACLEVRTKKLEWKWYYYTLEDVR